MLTRGVFLPGLNALSAAGRPDLVVDALLARGRLRETLAFLADLRGGPDEAPSAAAGTTSADGAAMYDETFAAAVRHCLRRNDADTAVALLRVKPAGFSWRTLHQLCFQLLDEDPAAKATLSPTAVLRPCFLEILRLDAAAAAAAPGSSPPPRT